MDTSLEYIKQCDCEEIQNSWGIDLGDFYTRDYNIDILSFKGCLILREDKTALGHVLWLPRQDQLQKMVKVHPFELLDKFHSFCMWDEQFEEKREKLGAISMEQLWLAFVMSELHHKVWDNEAWVKREIKNESLVV